MSDRPSTKQSIDKPKAKTPLIDIGLNLTNGRFKRDRSEILLRAQEAEVAHAIITGTSVTESQQALELCRHYASDFPGMLFSTAGVHPHDAKSWNNETLPRLQELITEPEVVAIGETGLDFNRDYSPRADQEKAFEAQLELAIESGLPLFLHERDAHQRQFEILKYYRDQFTDAVIHCFTGDRTSLFNYLDLGLHIGITGWVCDPKRGLELQRIVHNIPLDRLMIESDAPFLFPANAKPAQTSLKQTKQNKNRNEPAYLAWVLKGLAQCRQESEEQLAVASTSTALRFFSLPFTDAFKLKDV